MTGWLRWSEEKCFFSHLSHPCPLGYPLLAVSLPPGDAPRRLDRGARLLSRRGIRRVVAAPGLDDPARLAERGLVPVDGLPLCQAMGARLAFHLLKAVPVRERRVALRGASADGAVWALAEALCPQVGALLLDLDSGEEALARRLRSVYGAVPLRLGWADPPQVSLELSPRAVPVSGHRLKLWGEPELAGLEMIPPDGLPPDLPTLPFLRLLWEAGRLAPEEIPLRRIAGGP